MLLFIWDDEERMNVGRERKVLHRTDEGQNELELLHQIFQGSKKHRKCGAFVV
ncbi:hypothetical protein JCM9140_1927 [Halalkalibacter wakoensis JCM 9140]|uniref:Uncharacterized protein n=1 Tax=Halalkalibacter wakoensis JCM 9140 TaxID=1236970 RepID=W4Q1I4_9BACI|nr:hypothetical protein JCM9140_1927 [Halalkalibacter wakoensis JCM 9140]